MSDEQSKPIDLASEGGVSAKHPPVADFSALVGPTTGNEHNTVIAGLIPIACWRVDDFRFEFDSSIVKPEIAREIKLLAQLVKEHPDCPLSIFGHADPVGNDDYNKALSGRRAMAIYAMLIRETDLWEKLYSQPFGNDKWGIK